MAAGTVTTEPPRTMKLVPSMLRNAAMSIDPPSTHFYGMPTFYYESAGILIGFLWNHHMPYNDIMGGPVTTEYAYSYDGELWNRTHTIAMPRREYDEYGGGSLYGSSLIEREEDILVYAVGRIDEHGAGEETIQKGIVGGTLLAGRLRKNGFVFVCPFKKIHFPCVMGDQSDAFFGCHG